MPPRADARGYGAHSAAGSSLPASVSGMSRAPSAGGVAFRPNHCDERGHQFWGDTRRPWHVYSRSGRRPKMGMPTGLLVSS